VVASEFVTVCEQTERVRVFALAQHGGRFRDAARSQHRFDRHEVVRYVFGSVSIGACPSYADFMVTNNMAVATGSLATSIVIRLANDSEPAFSVLDEDRASRSIRLLVSEEAAADRFAAEFLAHLEAVPERDDAGVTSVVDDPPELPIRDQIAANKQPPRKAA
jgi:hypothetical protein